MNTRELIQRIQNIDPTLELGVHVEGCDCVGVAAEVTIGFEGTVRISSDCALAGEHGNNGFCSTILGEDSTTAGSARKDIFLEMCDAEIQRWMPQMDAQTLTEEQAAHVTEIASLRNEIRSGKTVLWRKGS